MTDKKLAALAMTVFVLVAAFTGGATVAIFSDEESISVGFDADVAGNTGNNPGQSQAAGGADDGNETEANETDGNETDDNATVSTLNTTDETNNTSTDNTTNTSTDNTTTDNTTNTSTDNTTTDNTTNTSTDNTTTDNTTTENSTNTTDNTTESTSTSAGNMEQRRSTVGLFVPTQVEFQAKVVRQERSRFVVPVR